jgi:exosortase A
MNTVLMAPSLSKWLQATAISLASVVALLLVYYGTTASIVAIWIRSETYAHGFVIFPIAAYLIWRQRAQIAGLTPAPEWRGLVLFIPLGLGWLAGNVARVLVVQQLALVAMIPALVITLLGWRVARAMAFPLAFLFLAVPMGEGLMEPLMNFTADFAVTSLQLTGIPVHREGTFFSIPGSNWSVIQACSGIRYLTASFTVGSLYAYLTYRSLHRRLLYMLASLVVPVIANGMRAYMIVMIAYLSDMRLALGIDHYIYGAVFFGLVMLLMFWVGSFWREDKTATTEHDAMAPHIPVPTPAGGIAGPIAGIAAIALAVAALWPAYSAYVESRAPRDFVIRLAVPEAVKGWQADAPFTDWQPEYKGMDARLVQTYRKGDRSVTLFLAYYRYQRQGAELINSQNVMIHQEDPVWSNVGEEVRDSGHGGPGEVIQTKLRSTGTRLLIWNWNWLNGTETVNAYWAKLQESMARLLGRREDAAAIIVYTPQLDTDDQTAAVLQQFLSDMLPSITATLEKASGT